jgi:hypothetical protein
MRLSPIVGVVLALAVPARAATLKVGPGKTYAKPCQAVAAAQAGDLIEIDPGVYQNDFCLINTSNLTIRGVGATRPHLQATVLIPNGKGIFVVPSGVGPVTVENIEFSGAKVSDNNGAGIRMQGASLTVRNCYFHDNQNGILSGGTADYEVTIEGSEFAGNGNAGSGYEHNIYIGGGCKSFTFDHSYTHHAKSGHNLKSRCDVNHIRYSRLMDEATGSSSYVIDLPQGGRSYLIGNLIQQGPQAENTSTIISYKCESATNPELELYVVNNTIVNDNAKTTTKFVRVCQGNTVAVINNLFVGPGAPVEFSGSYTDSGNLQPSSPGLMDQAAYDYRLTASSPAVDQGVDPGSGGGVSLTPTQQYVHPLGVQPRPKAGALDVGAYELAPPTPDGGPSDGPLGDLGPTDGPPPSDGARPDVDAASAGDGAVSTTDGQAAGDGRARADEGCGCDLARRPRPLLPLGLLLLGLLVPWRRARELIR